jgi:hypothetical protein
MAVEWTVDVERTTETQRDAGRRGKGVGKDLK